MENKKNPSKLNRAPMDQRDVYWHSERLFRMQFFPLSLALDLICFLSWPFFTALFSFPRDRELRGRFFPFFPPELTCLMSTEASVSPTVPHRSQNTCCLLLFTNCLNFPHNQVQSSHFMCQFVHHEVYHLLDKLKMLFYRPKWKLKHLALLRTLGTLGYKYI